MIEAQVNSLPINVVDFFGRIYTHERDKVLTFINIALTITNSRCYMKCSQSPQHFTQIFNPKIAFWSSVWYCFFVFHYFRSWNVGCIGCTPFSEFTFFWKKLAQIISELYMEDIYVFNCKYRGLLLRIMWLKSVN